MKIPFINKQEPLPVEAGVSKLYKVEFARNPHPALLKTPRNFWDEMFIANEAQMLDEITHPRIRPKLAFDAASHRLFLKYVEAATLNDLVQAKVTLKKPGPDPSNPAKRGGDGCRLARRNPVRPADYPQ